MTPTSRCSLQGFGAGGSGVGSSKKRCQINTQLKEDTILRRKKTYNKETVVVRSSKTIMEGRARR